jgi:hypothetical protein
MLGEDFKEVSPGYLPRTLDELRAGRRVEEVMDQVPQDTSQTIESTGPSLEDALEQLLQDASVEEARAGSTTANTRAPMSSAENAERTYTLSIQRQLQAAAASHQAPRNNIHAQAMNPAPSRNRDHQQRRIAALRRELNRMRNGIERVITGESCLTRTLPPSLSEVYLEV